MGTKGAAEGRILPLPLSGRISRSTAAAFILSALEIGLDEESLIVAKSRLILTRPQAMPNYGMIKYADEILGLDGLMLSVLEEVFITDSRIKHIFAKS